MILTSIKDYVRTLTDPYRYKRRTDQVVSHILDNDSLVDSLPTHKPSFLENMFLLAEKLSAKSALTRYPFLLQERHAASCFIFR